jgi:predicted house-cleaning noncanonical NTP pyrophosphatase (MazG superfamily)
MRTFLQKKLWRDKAIDMMEQNHGSKIHWRQLNDQEFNQQIRIKLLEEAEEVVAAQSRNELINELADLGSFKFEVRLFQCQTPRWLT